MENHIFSWETNEKLQFSISIVYTLLWVWINKKRWLRGYIHIPGQSRRQQRPWEDRKMPNPSNIDPSNYVSWNNFPPKIRYYQGICYLSETENHLKVVQIVQIFVNCRIKLQSFQNPPYFSMFNAQSTLHCSRCSFSNNMGREGHGGGLAPQMMKEGYEPGSQACPGWGAHKDRWDR